MQITAKILWTKEANEEAEKIMYSKNNILNVNGSSTRRIEFEAIQTLYNITKNTNDKHGSISNEMRSRLIALEPKDITFELLLELFADTTSIQKKKEGDISKAKSKLHLQDKMVINKGEYCDNPSKIETTVGKFIYNKFMIEGLDLYQYIGYVDWELTDSGNAKLEGILSQLLLDDKIETKTFFKYVDYRDWLGEQLHFVVTTSFTMGILKTPKEIKDLKKKLIDENREALKSGDVVLAESIEKQLIAKAKDVLKDDVGMDLYNSEARGSFKNNYKNINIIKGPVFNNNTGKYDFIESSYMEGIRKEDIPSYGNAVVLGGYPINLGHYRVIYSENLS